MNCFHFLHDRKILEKCEDSEVMGIRGFSGMGLGANCYFQARNNVPSVEFVYAHVIRGIFKHMVLSFSVCLVSVSASVGCCED